MSGVFSRLLGAIACVAVGAGAGYFLGIWMDAPRLGTAAGMVLGTCVLVLADALRARRLTRWLGGTQESDAPRDAGFWGELGYRVERVIRLRDKAVLQEKARLSQFLSGIEASPNGVLLLASDDRITWCNTVAADHFGLDPVRDLQQRITNLVRAPAFVAHLQSGEYGDRVSVPDVRGRGTLNVLVREYGEGLKLVLSQDVTERERADGMRRDFVANVSHEIRTPLTVLSGFIETMSQLPLTEAERQRVLMLMGQQTQRMQTLVSDLLTLAQLEGSPRPPSDHWISAGTLLQRAHADAVALSMGRHQISMTDASDVQLAATDGELMSAVGNLMANAVRYTPEGGRIELLWRTRDDGSGIITVKDTGIGVARDQISRLTERFYRVDGSRSRDTGGTGLGLSIVKHVAQRHGGELDIQSELGKGSAFSFILPPARVRLSARTWPERAVSDGGGVSV